MKIHESWDSALVLVLKSSKNSVFGAFFHNEYVKLQHKFTGSSDNFVFKISPEFKIFKSDEKKNDYYFYSDEKSLYLGGGYEGAALCIGGDLTKGHSMRSATFTNEPLHRYGKIWKRRDNF